MGRLLVFIILFAVTSLPANAVTIKPLPTPKSLPKAKPLPVPKALPKPQALPKPNPLPKLEEFVYLPPAATENNANAESTQENTLATTPDDLVADTESEPGSLQDGLLSLTFNDVLQGDIRILATDTLVTVFLAKDTLLNLFQEHLTPEIYRQLRSHYVEKQWINYQDLIPMGFEIVIDNSNLVAELNVPAHYRKVITKQLGGSVAQDRVIDVQAAAFSASLTPYWSRSWRDKKTLSDYVNLDAAMNINGWVLENSSTYDVMEKSHKRKITRLVRDFPDQITRLSIGDIEYKTTGLLGKKSMTGFSITREFSLQPNLLINPVAHQRIFVESESTVKIFVNDIPRQTLQLQAGYYDLQDFPLIDGINFVRIEITDQAGQITNHKFVGFDNNKVLVPGLSDYSFSVGVSRLTQHLETTRYDKGQPVFSAYAKHGITKNITLGILSEGQSDFISTGAYGVATSLLGTFEASALSSVQHGNKGRMGYGSNINHFISTSRFSLSNTINWKSKNFTYLGKNEYSTLQRVFYSGSVSLPLPYIKRWRQSYSAYYEQNWDKREEYRISAKVSGRVSKNMTISLDGYTALNKQKNNAGKGIRVSLTWRPRKRLSTNFSYDNLTAQKQINIARSFNGELGTAFNASVAENKTSQNFKGGVNWKTSLFNTHINSSNIRKDGAEQSQTYESFSISSSFAMINRSFAFGRPIGNGSFAIIKSGSQLGFDKIYVGRGGDLNNQGSMSYLSGSNSATIFPNLSAYGASTLHLVPESENDYLDLSKRKYRIFSGYRSGAIVEITKHINVYGAGVLTDNEWLPIKLVKGTFHNLETNSSSRFFTDEEGYFEVENLQPGNYKISLDTEQTSAEVTVESGQSRLIDFGIVRMAKFP